MVEEPLKFAEVIVPLALDGFFTYFIPSEMSSGILPGMRVEIEFGKSKRYSGIVRRIKDQSSWQKTKPIIEVLDSEPIVTEKQMELWEWISTYYMCSIGEVMIASVPSQYRLSSETMFVRSIDHYDQLELTDEEFLILEALDMRNQLLVQDIQSILQKKSVMKLVRSLLDRKLIALHEILQQQTIQKKTGWIRLNESLRQSHDSFVSALEQIQRSKHQTSLVLTYLQGNPSYEWRRQSEIQTRSGTSSAVLQSLVKKNILERIELDRYAYPEVFTPEIKIILSDIQSKAVSHIKASWAEKAVCLLHGLTGSGKTHIYINLILDMIASGKQVLYLLPEIALTAQLVIRLKKYFGDRLIEYHSGISQTGRLAAYHVIRQGHPIVIGARSSVFLPFKNLGLVIVDEEHDQGYKQSEPAPRYNARDVSLMLAQIHQAQVLLGSATPSLETYHNAETGRYGLVTLLQRHGESQLPDVEIIPIREEARLNQMTGLFSAKMLQKIAEQLQRKKQVIIFRNRRGYSPVIRCTNCNWEALCDQCDIHLTVHKQLNQIKCHICGIRRPVPAQCPQCHQHTVRMVGFGTEQVEEELQKLFPDVVVQRFDLDAARSKSSQSQILEDFHDGNIQILVGTQMLTKGLDFDQVVLVGVLQADQLFYYPDFRAQERAFQLLTQVSGRSGRRDDPGKVLIQAFNTSYKVLGFVARHDYNAFYQNELEERRRFAYPPWNRIIRIELRHRREHIAQKAAEHLVDTLKPTLSFRVLGPSDASLSKIKGFYAKEIYIKMEKNNSIINSTKILIRKNCQELSNQSDWRSIRIIVDVDPY
ncbi:MAG: primosomal protein N' [Saprospiraceae bacterium]